ncbi:MAG TPA: A/G-specific adenine glycosylase, partial [Syntrophomonadaceae bacterium]|nr:A/G-specific adenine glycosylase [Syntrophomonadaceae bacterium]
VQKLLEWYRENKRDLPWRWSSDPYRVWISEIMLQQTRVETVISYYQRFLQHFPHINTLADASEDQVLELWKGLGYYSRARSLRKTARMLVEQYQGCFPSDITLLRKLPGIGAYTAGAIMSIAFNQPYPAVDGNVLRVVTRLAGMVDDIGQSSTRKRVEDLVSAIIPHGDAADFTQGLMELGALQCTPQNPSCDTCWLRPYCIAYRQGQEHSIPFRAEAPKPSPQLSYWTVVVENQGKLLLEYREKETLLAKMWGLPILENRGLDVRESQFHQKYGCQVIMDKSLGLVKHVFTHRIWLMEVVSGQLITEPAQGSSLVWKEVEDIKHLAVPVAFQKVLNLWSE